MGQAWPGDFERGFALELFSVNPLRCSRRGTSRLAPTRGGLRFVCCDNREASARKGVEQGVTSPWCGGSLAQGVNHNNLRRAAQNGRTGRIRTGDLLHPEQALWPG